MWRDSDGLVGELQAGLEESAEIRCRFLRDDIDATAPDNAARVATARPLAQKSPAKHGQSSPSGRNRGATLAVTVPSSSTRNISRATLCG